MNAAEVSRSYRRSEDAGGGGEDARLHSRRLELRRGDGGVARGLKSTHRAGVKRGGGSGVRRDARLERVLRFGDDPGESREFRLRRGQWNFGDGARHPCGRVLCGVAELALHVGGVERDVFRFAIGELASEFGEGFTPQLSQLEEVLAEQGLSLGASGGETRGERVRG